MITHSSIDEDCFLYQLTFDFVRQIIIRVLNEYVLNKIDDLSFFPAAHISMKSRMLQALSIREIITYLQIGPLLYKSVGSEANE